MPIKKALRAICAASIMVGLASVAVSAAADGVKVFSDTTARGFKFPESVAFDGAAKVLYVSQFGSELKPTQKDAKGYISKVALDGSILEEKFLPAAGHTLNKPKGIWVAGDRLWVTDIDAVWVFDINSKEGRKIDLPGSSLPTTRRLSVARCTSATTVATSCTVLNRPIS